ncbi:5-methyltetrahydropteroyltriglutamate--homocysteine S-methyltransferase [Xylanibacillus composti]|uniref:5-methyltetrahydropteroyltriglutamate--homocysteine methyltransferase n=1 Tax=Xylanibacillus composti TaxID=1572762 RepID=A0A8J4H3B0_9BACL|nr:5-methyltetrahydropteroyltriglutamate--homocysteine S-methyltransferase [Xylanibacillus composti]MDT9726077.1 5-methyltetrahydropteroyltriglutamate--homocysteine S-methyltransferase [Xylanibacillus composti]GIQ68776.1 5-methyltetrahydropteroyltriglutamate--homocysteine methyltransferase [Xylanibacillus composti]
MGETVTIGNLGYPRIGSQREWKKALEAYWAGKLEETDFLQEMARIRLEQLELQKDKGVELIPVNDFTFYDHMLDMAVMFGIVPERFAYKGGQVSLDTYFAMARGSKQAAACEMTKWFNTNYHYIVPEIGGQSPALTENKPLAAYRFAKQHAGIAGKPVIVGLYTFLKLSKGFQQAELGQKVGQFLPVYLQMLKELEQEGVNWVQIDEPVLVTDVSDEDMEQVERIYRAIAQEVPGLHVMLQTYFEGVDRFEQVVQLPVHGIGLDFVHDRETNLQAIARYGFPRDKRLGVGLIDGRSIWRADLDSKLRLVETLAQSVPYEQMILQPSCSLMHVPVSTEPEEKLDPVIRKALAFANEKLDELKLLARAIRNSAEAAGELEASRQHLDRFRSLPQRNRQDVVSRQTEWAKLQDKRSLVFAERFPLQQEKWGLPVLPTTTIGSFPQTPEVRQARLRWRRNEWDQSQYESFLQEQIASCIRLQEELGLDVLVHGEFERTDMVEFFGEKLDGFIFTQNGWVQSYGSRCVKPPVIYGDVAFREPMTVKESVYAQSLTSQPVKGMLTGPITILCWSFVRDDRSREQVANQIALALRQEVEALEAAGIEMIQVDEPALREGFPLKERDRESYLDWATRAFRIATSSVKDTTQIHTHMCYCEFHDILHAILALDADVISIETSRSHGELIAKLEGEGYDHGIGLGVYDIHSPRVPSTAEMMDIIERALQVLDPALFWVNPDCGLKTRGLEETKAALANMVAAAREARRKWLLASG